MEDRPLTLRWNVTDDCARCSSPPIGWMPMLDRLMAALLEIPDWDAKYVEQIKSKFGGLRFYYKVPPEAEELRSKVEALIEQFEEEAAETCAQCGSAESVKTAPDKRGWVHTECANCYERR